jgi:hypothetical protein
MELGVSGMAGHRQVTQVMTVTAMAVSVTSAGFQRFGNWQIMRDH